MSQTSTFLFADIAGFTALTEAHGDEEAADLALEFCQRVHEQLAPRDGEIVKTIGDALMIRLTSSAYAIDLGLTIAHDIMSEHGQPTVRVGMHAGPATQRGADFFGATVNLAARITGAAAGGEVLVSETVRKAVSSGLVDVTFTSRGEVRLRNVAVPVALYSVERSETTGRVAHPQDPVCRMLVFPGREARRVTHDGAIYLFCSEHCAEQFTAAPTRYISPPHTT